MSTTIDSKVVEMKFDNRQFEQNVSTTMSSLDKLKQSLNLSGASKGLENIQDAASKVNFSGLTAGVEAVQTRFSYLQATIQHQLNNIVDSAVSAGKRIVSALTIDPIKTGFSEYETQINAVQTILANTQSKGTTLKDVNSALDELNTYADKTIYNFTEMTKNIGTFTAAGVDLNTSVNAIQGIANLAAVSGSTSQQASTAMYQLSQALSSGTVKLMDWNSVVNAGMGGQVFQDALKETARVHGIAIDEMIANEGSFRDTLQNGWLTSEILTETLQKFTLTTEGLTEAEIEKNRQMLKSKGYTDEQIQSIFELGKTATDAATKVKTFTQLWDTLKESAQSGWTQTWEYVVGDFEESKVLWTEVSDTIGAMIGKSAEVRNNLVKGALTSNWEKLTEKIEEAGVESSAFEEKIKEVASKHNVDVAAMIKEHGTLGEAFKKGAISSDILKEAVTGLSLNMNDLDIEGLIDNITELGGRDMLIESLWNAFNGILSVIKPIKEAFREIFPPTTAEQVYGIIEAIHSFTKKMTLSDTASDNLKRTFKGLFAALDIVKQAFSAVFNAITPLFGGIDNLGGGILGVTATWGDWIVKLNESIKTSDFFAKSIQKIKDFLNPVIEGIKVFGSSVSESFGDIFKNVGSNFEPLRRLGEGLKAIFMGIASAVTALSPIFSALASAVGIVFSQLQDGISSALQNADFNKLFDIANGGIFAAIGVGIAKFMNGAGDIFGEDGFIGGIKELLNGVSDALGAFTQSLKADTLQKIAIAIGVLAASLLVISLIDSEKLTGSLGAVTTLFVELLAALSIIDGMGLKGVTKAASAMTIMSVALLILSAAMKVMSTMSWEEMARGLISMTVGLGALIAAMHLLPKDVTVKTAGLIGLATAMVVLGAALKIMGSMSWSELAVGMTALVGGLGALVAAINLLPKDVILRTAGLVGLATAMVILGAALKIMGSMSWGELAVGLLAFAGSLAAIVIAMKLMPADLALKAVGMIAISTAMAILGAALKNMGGMSWGELAVAMVALAGSLTIIAVAMNFMSTALPGAAAMLVVSAALAIFAPVLMMLGSMSWGEIARGLVALAGAFAVIGIAGVILTPLVPTLVSLAGAIALLGLGCLAVGAGVMLFAAGITALSVALTAGGGAIVIFVSSLVGLIPYIIQQIGVGIIALCNVIAGGASSICAAVTTVIAAVIQALVTCIPLMVDAVGTLLVSLLEAIKKYLPDVLSLAVDIIVAFIDGISEGLPKIIQAGIDLMISFINGMADGIRDNTDATIAAVDNLMSAIVDAVVAWFEYFVSGGMDLVGELATGIINAIGDGVSAAGDLMCDIIDAISDTYSDFVNAGADLVAGFVNGIRDNISSAVAAAMDLAEDVWDSVCDFLGIKSPSRKFIEVGKYSDQGFVVGLKKYAGKVSDAATSVGDGALKAMSTSISGIASAISNDIDSQPTIRPVLDLSNVESGAGAIGSLLSGKRTLMIDTHIAGITSASMNDRQNGNEDVVSAINKLNKALSNLPSGDTYSINGITYDDGSNITSAVQALVRAARMERRV